MNNNVKPIKTYDYPYYCENCKGQIFVKIPFGELAMGKDIVCHRCGVNQQQVREWLQKEYGSSVMQPAGLKTN